jgi:MtrB/PioB family decaheme-associated outer membrane protein
MEASTRTDLRHCALALALIAAFGPALAQDSEVEASVTVGAAGVDGGKADRAFFGQYNGLRDRDAYGLFGFDYDRRNAATGTWVQIQALNLGLDTRELNVLWKRQGDWRFSADYGELLRREIYTVDTGLVGAGTTAPQVVHLDGGPGSGSNFGLKTKRRGFGLAASKWLGRAFEFEASVRSENKEGSRLFGIGMTCPSTVAPNCPPPNNAIAGSAILLLPEPMKSNHSQIEARLSYAGERLRLSGGYYGSLYNNSYGTLTPSVPGSLNSPLGALLPLNSGILAILGNPVALPPDNQAHQLDLTGNYTITATTRAAFRFAYSRAAQDQGFAGAGLAGAPAGVTSLDGKVHTTLAQVGISGRPIPRLTLLAESRYEGRSDKTPIALYNIEGAATYTNRDYSRRKIRSRAQATYQFLTRYSGSVGAEYEFIDRAALTPSSAVAGISAMRQETEEITLRAELRRRMSETFSGSIAYLWSDRDGSNWLRPNSGRGVTEVADPATGFDSTAIFSPALADRRRDKVRLTASWQATGALSVQASAEDGRDRFSAPSRYALREAKMDFYGVDVGYVVSETWNVNGYFSRGTSRLDQARPAGSIIAYDNTSTSFGVGFGGRPAQRFEVGGSLSYIHDRNEHGQTLDELAPASGAVLLEAAGGLPDIIFRRTEARLFGRYALSKAESLRLEAIHYRARFNDWAYGFGGVPYLFSDNTTLSLQREQNATFVGLTYTYTWQ